VPLQSKSTEKRAFFMTIKFFEEELSK